MTQINSFNQNKNSIFNTNLYQDNHNFKEIKNTSQIRLPQNKDSFKILSNNINEINIEKNDNEEKTIKNEFWLKGSGTGKSTNIDYNCSSTLEIIEYPISDKPNNIKQNNINEKNNYKYDKNLQYYKMPIDIKGDSDDDIYLNDEDFEKFNKKEKSKISFQNTNYHNWSKPSSVANSDLFLDYKNQKKIVVILNNTKKYHQELKCKINNFKKLIYPIKESKNSNIKGYSDKKIKKENNYIYISTNVKENKNKKNIFMINSNKKNIFLKSCQKENKPFKRNIYYDNNMNNVKDTSITDIKEKDKYVNIVNFSNNSTIKSKDKIITNLFPKKSFNSRIDKKIKNNLKKEITDNDKKLSKKNNLNISSLIRTNSKEKYVINNIKNNNHIISKTNRSASKDRSKKDKNKFNKKNIINQNEENNSIKKNETKISNKKNIYDINHIFPYSNQNINRKNENIKKEKKCIK